MAPLHLNTKYLESYIAPHEMEAVKAQAELAAKTLEERTGAGNDFLGWLDLPVDYDKDEFARIKAAAKKIQSNSDILIVIGIGGSYLGARAAIELMKSPLYNNLKKDTPDIYYVGNNISPTYLNEIISICDGKDISVNVISKSGTTTEPALAFRVFRDLVEKKYGKEGAKERIFATTDKARGTLKELSDKEGYETFVIADDVGGRYSVLTAVGLLPIAVAGCDIDAVMAGAAQAREELKAGFDSNDCYTLLYTMYGVPSVYYGSEFGIRGTKGRGADADMAIRPCLELDDIPGRDDRLLAHISALGAIRNELPAIQSGSYKKLELKNQTFLYQREKDGQVVYIALNISDGDYTFNIQTGGKSLADRLSGRHFAASGNSVSVTVPKDHSMVLVDENLAAPVPEKPAAEPVKPAEPAPAPVPEKAPEAPAPEQKTEAPKGTPSVGIPEGRSIVIGGHYKHFKGGDYVVLNLAYDHETMEKQVVYMQIYDKPRVWVRPLSMFLEDVNDHGNIKPRFEFIGMAE